MKTFSAFLFSKSKERQIMNDTITPHELPCCFRQPQFALKAPREPFLLNQLIQI